MFGLPQQVQTNLPRTLTVVQMLFRFSRLLTRISFVWNMSLAINMMGYSAMSGWKLPALPNHLVWIGFSFGWSEYLYSHKARCYK